MASVSFLQNLIDQKRVIKTCEEYIHNKTELLFRRLLSETSCSKNTIEIFDHWIEEELPLQIESQSFKFTRNNDDLDVKFSFNRIDTPRRPSSITSQEEILLPNTCRQENIPYLGELFVDVNIYKNDEQFVEYGIPCGKIPIMLGSRYCHLRDKTPEQLLSMGECISDPFGYFLISSEMSLITQEKSRTSIPVVFNGKNGPQCKFTTNYVNGTKIILITMGKKWNTIKVKIPSILSKDKLFPIFAIYHFLLTDPENQPVEGDFSDYILKYVPLKFKRRILVLLNDSIVKYNNIMAKDGGIIRYIVDRMPMQRNGKKTWKIEYKPEDAVRLFNVIREKILKELFVNIDDLHHKSDQLGFITAKFVLTIANILPYESRDSWVVKKFESAGRSMSLLFSDLFQKVVLMARDEYDTANSTNIESYPTKVKNNASKYITKEFKAAFNTEVWAVKQYIYKGRSMSGWSRENISNSTDRQTPLSLFSQLDKSNTPTSRQTRSTELREVQPTQRNRHCPSETPEGENNGLNKYKSLLCIFSMDISKESNQLLKSIIIETADKQRTVVMDMDMIYHVTLNGETIMGYKVGKSFMEQIRKLRAKPKFRYLEVFCDTIMETIEIYTDASRPLCPYLRVENGSLLIEENDGWGMTSDELLNSRYIEYISPREEENVDFILCTSVDKFMNPDANTVPYTHCNIDPNQMFSTATSVAPMTDRQPGPRNTYQASMGKQAMGSFCLNHHTRYYTTYRVLHRGARAFTETDTYFLPKMDIMPCGQTVNVAFMTDPDNQEDAVVVSEDAINAGLFNFYKYTTIKIDKRGSEKIRMPSLRQGESSNKYRNINSDGYPSINSFIQQGDCILGKTNDRGFNTSCFTGVGETGYVDRIYKSYSDNSHGYIKIKLRKFSKYKEGDKEAFRYSQKGTIGRVEKRKNMIRVTDGPNKGITPDIIFNPHGFPSRSTMGIIFEGILTKAAIYNGKRVNVSAFRQIDLKSAQETLSSVGLDENGYENMETSSGVKLSTPIFFVPLYSQALKHHVDDKISMRGSGRREIYTHQPKGGRTQGGAQKVGEMEKDAFVAHGASGIIIDRMRICSDEFKIAVCKKCGNILGKKDITPEYYCTVCKEDNTAGILTVSYVFKVLLNLLMGIGIDVNINTSIKEN